MNGKGDGNLHGRRQCSDREMEIRWELTFGKHSPEKRKAMEFELEVINKAKPCTTQQS